MGILCRLETMLTKLSVFLPEVDLRKIAKPVQPR